MATKQSNRYNVTLLCVDGKNVGQTFSEMQNSAPRVGMLYVDAVTEEQLQVVSVVKE